MLNSTNVRIYFDKHLEVIHINWILTFLPHPQGLQKTTIGWKEREMNLV